MLKNFLVLLHIITAAGWFGYALVIGGLARQAVAGAGSGVVEEGTKTVKLMNIFILLTLVFGLLAFFMGGGFGGYGPQFHTSLLLIVILVGIQYMMIRPAWSKIVAAGADSASARKRVAMGTGIGHLIWLIVLILMLWNRYPLA